MTEIDREIYDLVPESVVKVLCREHGVRVVRKNYFLSLEKTPAAFLVKSATIVFDPDCPVGQIRDRLNREFVSFDLKEEETWPYVFCHECYHCSHPEATERECHDYSIGVIRRYRAAVEAKQAKKHPSIFDT